jgi:hypothetical protein
MEAGTMSDSRHRLTFRSYENGSLMHFFNGKRPLLEIILLRRTICDIVAAGDRIKK